jgi:hypothetical protein
MMLPGLAMTTQQQHTQNQYQKTTVLFTFTFSDNHIWYAALPCVPLPTLPCLTSSGTEHHSCTWCTPQVDSAAFKLSVISYPA